jgi:peptidoglycan/xylan/chitin deacetylase (PgdA/CDA1 family)
LRNLLVRSSLEALYFSGVHSLLRRRWSGIGAILTLHHVRPARRDAFQPNRSLEVTPEFLDGLVGTLRCQGFDLVSLDEMHRRLQSHEFTHRFICLTFDDAYRDTLEFAYPIMKRHDAPFAIYVPTSFPDRRGYLWWLTLEAVIAAVDRVDLPRELAVPRLPCRTLAQKRRAIGTIHAILSAENEERLRAIVDRLAEHAGIAPVTSQASLCMSWQELADIATDPLVTIGAHTVNHLRLRNATKLVASDEMAKSAARIKAMLGLLPAHFSYPYGDPTAAGPREFSIAREIGFKTAVTTRPGMLFPEHRDHLTALPRISVNGQFQCLRHMTVLTSGVATALLNRFQRINASH